MSAKEKRIFILHMAYSIIEGAILGIIALNEIVFLKSLEGSRALLGLLVQFSTLVLLITVIINEIVRRHNKKKLLRLVAVVTRLPMIALLFFPADKISGGDVYYHLAFVALFLLFFSAKPFVLPAINYYLKTNYGPERFGRLFGYSSAAQKTAIILATFIFGVLLDYDAAAYRYVYPAMAVASLASMILISLMDDGAVSHTIPKKPMWQSAKESMGNMLSILKQNKPYRDFEISFMLYGIAFLTALAVIPIYLIEDLGLSYSGVAIYKNFYNILAILMVSAFGVLMDKIDPRKFANYTFLSLLLFYLFLSLAEAFPAHVTFTSIDLGFFKIAQFKLYYMLALAYLSYGFFAAMMGLVWTMGSSYFAPGEMAADYQSAHLTFVGMRSVIAPLFGVWVYEIAGPAVAFGICMLFIVAAMVNMSISMRRYKRLQGQA